MGIKFVHSAYAEHRHYEYQKRDDATGAYLGQANRCGACREFFDTLHCRNGASDDHGDWRCRACIDAHRPTPKPDAREIDIKIPDEYASASLLDLPPSVSSRVKLWPFQEPFVCVSGCPGSGKSRLTWAWVRSGAKQGRAVNRIDSMHFQAMWTGAKSPMDRYALQSRVAKSAYLILDDMSGCQASEAWTAMLHTLIDQRRFNRSPLVITTASSQDALSRIYGPAINSRLAQFEWIRLPDVDHRKEK